ncbi:MAG: hypothetical protein NVSMB51_18900 [Solirubrobacteraceae bacterium]
MRVLRLIPVLLLLAPAAARADSLTYGLRTEGGAPASAVITASKLKVRGTVQPFVAGQSVTVHVYRGQVTVGSRTVPVQSGGRFEAVLPTGARPGTLTINVGHLPTPEQAAIATPARHLPVVAAHAYRGSRGPSVRLLQHALIAEHYALGLTGRFDGATGRAVEALRKLTGQARTQQANRRVFELLARGAGAFHPRYPKQGNHFEGDLSHQVLAEVSSGGQVRRIYPMSSGKPSTPTVVGVFHVYDKQRGTNAKGMVDANYFIRGYAIHGYAEVPTYAASHGCLRVPIPDAAAIFNWARIGYAVDVYTRNGRGSHRVQRNAGP